MDISSPLTESQGGIGLLSIQKLLKSQGGQEFSIYQGQTLFYEDLRPIGIFFLLSGKVKIIKEYPLGKQKMISILNSMNLLGLNDFLNGSFYRYSAIALEDCELIFLNEVTTRTIISFPEFQKHLSPTVN